ncbi:hypothetical protein P5V47_17060, partial [Mycobacteroides abscessus subsp. massiliense]|nr:hypothetical protein [Mycobacteroides abscessus subsp. massiliense]
MAKKKPTAEPDGGSIARPPWLPPPEKERRWSLSGLGSKKKDQRDPARDREDTRVVDLDGDDYELDDDDQVVGPSAAAVPETTPVEDVVADEGLAPAGVDEPVNGPRRVQADHASVAAQPEPEFVVSEQV